MINDFMSRAQTASWCRRRESNPYALKRAADFKSATSTNFVTPAIPYAYKKRGTSVPLSLSLERETSLELATSTLARLRSTN